MAEFAVQRERVIAGIRPGGLDLQHPQRLAVARQRGAGDHQTGGGRRCGRRTERPVLGDRHLGDRGIAEAVAATAVVQQDVAVDGDGGEVGAVVDIAQRLIDHRGLRIGVRAVGAGDRLIGQVDDQPGRVAVAVGIGDRVVEHIDTDRAARRLVAVGPVGVDGQHAEFTTDRCLPVGRRDLGTFTRCGRGDPGHRRAGIAAVEGGAVRADIVVVQHIAGGHQRDGGDQRIQQVGFGRHDPRVRLRLAGPRGVVREGDRVQLVDRVAARDVGAQADRKSLHALAVQRGFPGRLLLGRQGRIGRNRRAVGQEVDAVDRRVAAIGVRHSIAVDQVGRRGDRRIIGRGTGRVGRVDVVQRRLRLGNRGALQHDRRVGRAVRRIEGDQVDRDRTGIGLQCRQQVLQRAGRQLHPRVEVAGRVLRHALRQIQDQGDVVVRRLRRRRVGVVHGQRHVVHHPDRQAGVGLVAVGIGDRVVEAALDEVLTSALGMTERLHQGEVVVAFRAPGGVAGREHLQGPAAVFGRERDRAGIVIDRSGRLAQRAGGTVEGDVDQAARRVVAEIVVRQQVARGYLGRELGAALHVAARIEDDVRLGIGARHFRIGGRHVIDRDHQLGRRLVAVEVANGVGEPLGPRLHTRIRRVGVAAIRVQDQRAELTHDRGLGRVGRQGSGVAGSRVRHADDAGDRTVAEGRSVLAEAVDAAAVVIEDHVAGNAAAFIDRGRVVRGDGAVVGDGDVQHVLERRDRLTVHLGRHGDRQGEHIVQTGLTGRRAVGHAFRMVKRLVQGEAVAAIRRDGQHEDRLFAARHRAGDDQATVDGGRDKRDRLAARGQRGDLRRAARDQRQRLDQAQIGARGGVAGGRVGVAVRDRVALIDIEQRQGQLGHRRGFRDLEQRRFRRSTFRRQVRHRGRNIRFLHQVFVRRAAGEGHGDGCVGVDIDVVQQVGFQVTRAQIDGRGRDPDRDVAGGAGRRLQRQAVDQRLHISQRRVLGDVEGDADRTGVGDGRIGPGDAVDLRRAQRQGQQRLGRQAGQIDDDLCDRLAVGVGCVALALEIVAGAVTIGIRAGIDRITACGAVLAERDRQAQINGRSARGGRNGLLIGRHLGAVDNRVDADDDVAVHTDGNRCRVIRRRGRNLDIDTGDVDIAVLGQAGHGDRHLEFLQSGRRVEIDHKRAGIRIVVVASDAIRGVQGRYVERPAAGRRGQVGHLNLHEHFRCVGRQGKRAQGQVGRHILDDAAALDIGVRGDRYRLRVGRRITCVGILRRHEQDAQTDARGPLGDCEIRCIDDFLIACLRLEALGVGGEYGLGGQVAVIGGREVELDRDEALVAGRDLQEDLVVFGRFRRLDTRRRLQRDAVDLQVADIAGDRAAVHQHSGVGTGAGNVEAIRRLDSDEMTLRAVLGVAEHGAHGARAGLARREQGAGIAAVEHGDRDVGLVGQSVDRDNQRGVGAVAVLVEHGRGERADIDIGIRRRRQTQHAFVAGAGQAADRQGEGAVTGIGQLGRGAVHLQAVETIGPATLVRVRVAALGQSGDDDLVQDAGPFGRGRHGQRVAGVADRAVFDQEQRAALNDGPAAGIAGVDGCGPRRGAAGIIVGRHGQEADRQLEAAGLEQHVALRLGNPEAQSGGVEQIGDVEPFAQRHRADRRQEAAAAFGLLLGRCGRRRRRGRFTQLAIQQQGRQIDGVEGLGLHTGNDLADRDLGVAADQNLGRILAQRRIGRPLQADLAQIAQIDQHVAVVDGQHERRRILAPILQHLLGQDDVVGVAGRHRDHDGLTTLGRRDGDHIAGRNRRGVGRHLLLGPLIGRAGRIAGRRHHHAAAGQQRAEVDRGRSARLSLLDRLGDRKLDALLHRHRGRTFPCRGVGSAFQADRSELIERDDRVGPVDRQHHGYHAGVAVVGQVDVVVLPLDHLDQHEFAPGRCGDLHRAGRRIAGGHVRRRLHGCRGRVRLKLRLIDGPGVGLRNLRAIVHLSSPPRGPIAATAGTPAGLPGQYIWSTQWRYKGRWSRNFQRNTCPTARIGKQYPHIS